jgi:hypothetical protein
MHRVSPTEVDAGAVGRDRSVLLAIRQDRNAGLAGLVTQIDLGGTSANKAVSPMAGG